MKRVVLHEKFRIVVTAKEDAKILKTCFGIKFIQLKVNSMQMSKIRKIINNRLDSV